MNSSWPASAHSLLSRSSEAKRQTAAALARRRRETAAGGVSVAAGNGVAWPGIRRQRIRQQFQAAPRVMGRLCGEQWRHGWRAAW